MEKISLESAEVRPQCISVQSIGSALAARAMDSLIETQSDYCVVRDGGNVVLIIGERGLSIARRLRMRVTRKHPERFVLIGDGSPIDFGLVRDIPIRIFVGEDESVEVLLEAIEAAARGLAFCSPQMVPALVESAQAVSSSKILEDSSHTSDQFSDVSAYRPPSLRVSKVGASGYLVPPDANSSTEFLGIERHIARASRLAHALGFTDREWEVTALAMEGLANSEIANQLAMSVPTVKFNLYRAYQKLGIRRRSQIANALMVLPVGALMPSINRSRAASAPQARFASRPGPV